jgi:phage terminase large subunit GpA-like protein
MNKAERTLFRKMREAFRMEPPETCLEWAERELHLGKKLSAEPGPFRIHSRPYLRAVLEALESACQTVILCWGSQLGKTLTLAVWLGFRIARDPANALILMPSESQARSYSQSRLKPLFDSAPSVRDKYPRNRDSITALEYRFQDCVVNLAGSNSAGEVASRPKEIVVGDEIDLFGEHSSDASPLFSALERTKSFPRSKHVLTSTPTTPQGDIWRAYLRGTQERFFIPCPSCGRFNYMDFRRDVVWDDARHPSGRWDLGKVMASACWKCPDCGEKMRSDQKVQAMQQGEWRATNPEAEPGVRSFHLNSLYAPQISFGAMAKKFLVSKDDLAALQVFITGWLAEPYEEAGSGANDDQVYECRGTYLKGHCPIEPFTMTICADPGELQTHWSVAAWSETGECYIVDYGTVLGPEDIITLAEQRTWRTPSGDTVRVTEGLIDSGDFTERIYGVCNRSTVAICPSKGSGSRSGQLVRESELESLRCLLYTYSDFHLKVRLYVDKLAKKLAPRLWFPQDSDTEFLRAHMGQRLVLPKGGKYKEWRRISGDHWGDYSKLHLVSWRIIQPLEQTVAEAPQEETSL